jgi:hypothetical protein
MYFFFREGFERRKLGVKIISKFTKILVFFTKYQFLGKGFLKYMS